MLDSAARSSTILPPTTSGDCTGLAIVCSPNSGSFFPVGTTTVACIATNPNGQTVASCSFKVTVNDCEAPKINCPGNIARPTDPDQCTAVVNYAATGTDNCPGVTVVCLPPSGTRFPIGSATVTCTATDATGNTTTCSFTVTITAGNKCPLAQGYWKNHPDAWPLSSVTLGAQSYSKAELLRILSTSTTKDASLILARQLIAAILNTANGSDPRPVCNATTQSNNLLSEFGRSGQGVRAGPRSQSHAGHNLPHAPQSRNPVAAGWNHRAWSRLCHTGPDRDR